MIKNYLNNEHVFIVFSCSYAHPLIVAQMAKKTRQINVWEINWSMDLKTVHKSEFTLDATSNTDTNVIGTFCSDGTICIAQSNGIWHVSSFTDFKQPETRNQSPAQSALFCSFS